ncbi:MAG: radical SAM protein, partial [bacterium]
MGVKRDEIHKRIKNIKWPIDRYPQRCEITVTHKCNLKCMFCYEEKEKIKDNPSIKLITNTLSLSKKMGSWICVIIGGEPTLRKDIALIGRIAKKIGYECIVLATNGTNLANEKYLKTLI